MQRVFPSRIDVIVTTRRVDWPSRRAVARLVTGGISVISTKLTEAFGLRHPIVLAPMGGVAGGRLAAAVSNAGGLGLVGGGYGDREWIAREIALVKEGTRGPWGIGFITWSMARDVLDFAL